MQAHPAYLSSCFRCTPYAQKSVYTLQGVASANSTLEWSPNYSDLTGMIFPSVGNYRIKYDNTVVDVSGHTFSMLVVIFLRCTVSRTRCVGSCAFNYLNIKHVYLTNVFITRSICVHHKKMAGDGH